MLVTFLIFPLTILAASCHGVFNPDRIVGGVPIEIEEAPYQVQLESPGADDNFYFRCGGSIIAKNVILTAAHCVTYENDLKVRVGTKIMEQGGKVYTISRKKIHDDNDPFEHPYDIALLWLKENLEYSKNVAPIALPLSDDVIEDGTMCNVRGWGRTSEGGEGSNVLLQTSIPIVNQKVCKAAYKKVKRVISDDMICAGFMEEGGKSSCQGDSGGPLVANGKQWGIVSWGRGCARPNLPGVYTRATYFINWIYNYVKFD